MKRTVLLLALYILLKPAVPVIDFMVNYGYIVAELCINRDRPELQCNGSCYLKNELAEASKQNNPISKDRKIPLPANELFYQQSTTTPVDMVEGIEMETIGQYRTTFHPREELNNIFRPPIFSS